MQCVQWLQCGTLPDWIVAVTAIVAAWLGIEQLRKLAASEKQAADAQEITSNAAKSMADLAKHQSEAVRIDRHHATLLAENVANQLQIARASLLLEIDRDFESPAMQESRLAVRTLFNRARHDARLELLKKNPSGVRDRANELFSWYTTELWEKFRSADEQQPSLKSTAVTDELADSAGPQYQKLTKILGWMETTGRMANENLAFEADILSLYDQVFINVFGYFRKHINDRRNDEVQGNLEWMRQAEIFHDKIVELREKANTTVGMSTKSATRWDGSPPATQADGEP